MELAGDTHAAGRPGVGLVSWEVWGPLATAHTERADALTAAHRGRRAAHQTHAVEDFLYDYYGTRPALLRRWHPGPGVGLGPTPNGPAEQSAWRWYRTDGAGVAWLDAGAFLADRESAVRFIHRLLEATESRPAFTGCFGLHEWAMVYGAEAHRHELPLRLGQAGTDAVVESHPIRCTHFDAFRFFTPAAAGLNTLQPTRATQSGMEQPGCLHAAMDCHKWASKLGPAVPGMLALDCFELAKDVRVLDMRASPYDLAAYAETPVAIETPAGKAEYVLAQQGFARRASDLRSRLSHACESILEAASKR